MRKKEKRRRLGAEDEDEGLKGGVAVVDLMVNLGPLNCLGLPNS